jgi:integrase
LKTDGRPGVPEGKGRVLAPATVVKAGQILSKIMATAVSDGRLTSNPCIGVRLPKVEREEMRFLSPAEVAALSGEIDPRFRALVYLGAYCGLRVGEMFGLRAGRLDLLRSRVDVVEIVVEVSGELHFGPPKTRAGRRSVPLPRVVIDALTEHLRAFPAGPSDFVFRAPEGGTVRLASWRRRYWNPAVKAAGLAPLRPHDLRHTAVALWIAAGASPKEVATRAGHSSVVTVLDRYGHLLPGSEERVNDALDRLAAAVPAPAPLAPIIAIEGRV